jgi:hypothetical protein
MTQQHPITPPLELVQKWTDEYIKAKPSCTGPELIATRAAQWGADQELEACCEWINSFQNKFVHAHDLRLVRRPNPPSLSPSPKWQALVALENGETASGAFLTLNEVALIRRALEQLPDNN